MATERNFRVTFHDSDGEQLGEVNIVTTKGDTLTSSNVPKGTRTLRYSKGCEMAYTGRYGTRAEIGEILQRERTGTHSTFLSRTEAHPEGTRYLLDEEQNVILLPNE